MKVSNLVIIYESYEQTFVSHMFLYRKHSSVLCNSMVYIEAKCVITYRHLSSIIHCHFHLLVYRNDGSFKLVGRGSLLIHILVLIKGSFNTVLCI